MGITHIFSCNTLNRREKLQRAFHINTFVTTLYRKTHVAWERYIGTFLWCLAKEGWILTRVWWSDESSWACHVASTQPTIQIKAWVVRSLTFNHQAAERLNWVPPCMKWVIGLHGIPFCSRMCWKQLYLNLTHSSRALFKYNDLPMLLKVFLVSNIHSIHTMGGIGCE